MVQDEFHRAEKMCLGTTNPHSFLHKGTSTQDEHLSGFGKLWRKGCLQETGLF